MTEQAPEDFPHSVEFSAVAREDGGAAWRACWCGKCVVNSSRSEALRLLEQQLRRLGMLDPA